MVCLPILVLAEGAFSIDRIYNESPNQTFSIHIFSPICQNTYVIQPLTYANVENYNCVLAEDHKDTNGKFIISDESGKQISEDKFTLENKYDGYPQGHWFLTIDDRTTLHNVYVFTHDAWFYLFIDKDGKAYAKDWQ